jgi:hypothetical protein
MAASDESNVNALALIFLVAMSVLILRSSSQKAVIALLLTALLIPLGQQIVIFGLHLRFYRLLILIGLWRLLMRGESKGFRATGMDKLLLAWTVVILVCGIIRGATAETFGDAYDTLGTYFLFRVWIHDAQDSIGQLRVLAMVVCLVALCMAYEQSTRHNLFSVFGGVPAITHVREGRFRCQGPFRHPILAGTFAATLFPLMAGLWSMGGRNKKTALLGGLACVFCTVAAASSGALMTFIAAIIGLAFWWMRFRMKLIRRCIVVVIIGLAIVMKAPIWYLIARISDLTGGTGWYRSNLITEAVDHFNEWWLVGSSYTANWTSDPTVLIDQYHIDITNQYIAQGLNGGLLGLGLFVAMIVCGFKVLGNVVTGRRGVSFDPKLWWAFGVSLFCHCAAFISVSYFDQITVFWLWLLATIATVQVTADKRLAASRRLQQVEEPPEPIASAAPG